MQRPAGRKFNFPEFSNIFGENKKIQKDGSGQRCLKEVVSAPIRPEFKEKHNTFNDGENKFSMISSDGKKSLFENTKKSLAKETGEEKSSCPQLKTNKFNAETTNPQVGNKKEASIRSGNLNRSFDEIMNAFLAPSRLNSAINSTTDHNRTFEELMDDMLSPNISVVEKQFQNSQGSNLSQKSRGSNLDQLESGSQKYTASQLSITSGQNLENVQRNSQSQQSGSSSLEVSNSQQFEIVPNYNNQVFENVPQKPAASHLDISSSQPHEPVPENRRALNASLGDQCGDKSKHQWNIWNQTNQTKQSPVDNTEQKSKVIHSDPQGRNIFEDCSNSYLVISNSQNIRHSETVPQECTTSYIDISNSGRCENAPLQCVTSYLDVLGRENDGNEYERNLPNNICSDGNQSLFDDNFETNFNRAINSSQLSITEDYHCLYLNISNQPNQLNNRNITEPQSCGQYPSNASEMLPNSCSEANGSPEINLDKNAPKIFGDMPSSSMPSMLEGSQLKPFRDVGTQTSFCETVCENPTLQKSVSSYDLNEGMQIMEQEHILEILSQDKTVLSNGLEVFNNISKIGTARWLESALVYVNGMKKFKKKPKLVEIKNDYNLYKRVKLSSRVILKRQGATNIYTIGSGKIGDDDHDDIAASTFSDLSTSTGRQDKLQTAILKICNNKEFLMNNDTMLEIDKINVKGAIHDIFAKLYHAFSKKEIPCLLMKNTRGRHHLKDGRLQWNIGLSKVKFNCKASRFNFCRMLYLMGKIYSLLSQNRKLTGRELFYQTKHIVSRQSLLQSSFENVTRIFSVVGLHLNVVSHNGLVYGNLTLHWANGGVTDCNSPATMIPYDMDDIIEIRSTAFFILVIEKESMFHKLMEEDLPNKLSRPFIMMTGKGVPDINTCAFLNKLSKIMHLPVFILVDADVYGIRIMLTYRLGSIRNCHLSEHLAVPNARWLGVFPTEISKYGMKHQTINATEKRCIKNLLKCSHLNDFPKIKKQLEFMLKSEKKASIEGLLKNNTFLSEMYLPLKFLKQDFI